MTYRFVLGPFLVDAFRYRALGQRLQCFAQIVAGIVQLSNQIQKTMLNHRLLGRCRHKHKTHSTLFSFGMTTHWFPKEKKNTGL